MAFTSILVFGTDPDVIQSWGKNIQVKCKEWGANLVGPISPPPVELERIDGELSHSYSNPNPRVGKWFDDIELSANERRNIFPSDSDSKVRIHSRLIRLEDNRAVRKIVNEQVNEDLHVRVEIEPSKRPNRSSDSKQQPMEQDEMTEEASVPIDRLMEDIEFS